MQLLSPFIILILIVCFYHLKETWILCFWSQFCFVLHHLLIYIYISFLFIYSVVLFYFHFFLLRCKKRPASFCSALVRFPLLFGPLCGMHYLLICLLRIFFWLAPVVCLVEWGFRMCLMFSLLRYPVKKQTQAECLLLYWTAESFKAPNNQHMLLLLPLSM